MKRFGAFAAATAVAIGLMAWAGVALFGTRIGPEGQQAVVLSAAVAFAVQLLTFGVARAIGAANMMAGWGMAMLVRFLTLVLHGFIGVPLLGLPMGAALLSLASFFFVSSIIEVFFLPVPSTPPKQ